MGKQFQIWPPKLLKTCLLKTVSQSFIKRFLGMCGRDELTQATRRGLRADSRFNLVLLRKKKPSEVLKASQHLSEC